MPRNTLIERLEKAWARLARRSGTVLVPLAVSDLFLDLCSGAVSELRARIDKRDSREETAKQMNFTFTEGCKQPDFNGADVTSTMATLASWSWLLKDFLESHPVDPNRPQPSHGRAARLVPRLEDYPWHGKLDGGEMVPLPFMTRDDFDIKVDSKYRLVSWEEWLTSKITEMSDPSYLAQSSWCGYWSFERHRRYDSASIEFADAVEGLNIHALHHVEFPVPHTRRLVGTYTEHTIDFHLEGYITPQGRFKLGPPGEFWAWMGWMTPFGLFGHWGGADGDQAAGACWLWQKTWTEEPNKERGAPSEADLSNTDQIIPFDDSSSDD